MGQFPHAQVPDSLQEDERASAFMEDVRLLLSQLRILGNLVNLVGGNGAPEGVVTAHGGSLYLRQDGPPWLYVKEAAGLTNTGWVSK